MEISLVENVVSRVISSKILSLTKMSILMVGEMLEMFPSSKVSGEGIGFLNQPTYPRGMK